MDNTNTDIQHYKSLLSKSPLPYGGPRLEHQQRLESMVWKRRTNSEIL